PAWTDEFPAGDGYGSGQGHHRADTCVCNQHWDTEELRKATLTQTLRGVRLTHTHTHTHTPTQTHTQMLLDHVDRLKSIVLRCCRFAVHVQAHGTTTPTVNAARQ